MNIFYLDPDPTICAQWHVDKHVVKMILEYAQLLSTAHRILDGVPVEVPYTPVKAIYHANKQFSHLEYGKQKVRIDLTLHHTDIMKERYLYRHTHPNHPSAIWVRESATNYLWLLDLLCALLSEYTYRYGKKHKTAALIPYLAACPNNITRGLYRTEPTPAMEEQYKVEGDSIASYHAYYNGAKRDMFAWKKREVPSFIIV
jgi:hypothetical protein